MKKRILSFVLALVMAVSLLPVSVLAAEDTPAVQVEYGPRDPDVKVIGTYQVDEDTTWDVQLVTVDSTKYNYIRTLNSTKTGVISTEKHKVGDLVPGKFVTSHYKGSETYESGIRLYDQMRDHLHLTVADALESTATKTCFYNFQIAGGPKKEKVREICGLLIIQWTAGEFVPPDKTKLQEAIETAPTADSGKYYTTGDKFNGKSTNPKGFWAEYQTKLKYAKRTNTNTKVTQEEIDNDVAKLQAAIANLIPTTQVNPTILHETLRIMHSSGFYEDATKYTPNTWAPFDAARTAAQALLDGLFDENGNATAANTAERQSEIDAAAAALTEAEKNLYGTYDVEVNKKTIERINTFLADVIALADTVKQSDYTAESWATFAAALTAARNAKAPVLTDTKADDASVAAYKKVYEDLYQQFYCGLTPVGEITVSLTYLDPEKARQGNGTGSRAGAAQQVTLSDDYSLYAAVDSLKNKPDRFIIGSNAKIFINGIYVTECYISQDSHDCNHDWRSDTVSKNLRLHPGDTVVVDLNLDPQSEFQPTIYDSSAQLWQYIDSIKTSQFVQSNGLEVKAGEPFTLTIQQAKAALGRSRAVEAGANMTLFISDMAEAPADNHPTKKQITQNEKAVITDADGSASVTLYREGWHLIAAYDLRKDEKGNIDNGFDGKTPSYAGKYYSANSGAAIWVHVNTPDDLSAVKNTLQSQLDKAYAAYAENYFRPAVWSELKSAYDTGTAGIKAAATSAGASDAQQTAIETIRKLQNNTTAENKQNLTTFRTALNKLPDDASLLSAGVKSTVDKLIACYEGMSDYQRRQLTGVEQTKYNSIKAFADTHETFPEDKAFKLTVNVVGDTDEVTAALNDMTKYLREHPATQDRGSGGRRDNPIQTDPFCVFTAAIPESTEVTTAAAWTTVRFVSSIDYAAYFQTRAAKGTFTVDGAKWSISNENLHFTTDGLGYTVNGGLTVTIGGEAYEIKSITYQGIDPGSIKSGRMIAYDDTEYLGKNKDYINMRFEDAVQKFTMPYNDVTVTVTWGPVSENVNATRTAALSRLQTLYNSLGDKAKAAYDTGVDSINAAASVTAVETAYQSAVVAMKKAANNYGKVQVIVENTTYSKKDGALWDGTLVNTWVDLSADSTMMSCVVDALKTKNATVEGAESNYISSINGLKEFDGGKSSGWMGTLNDWFTNEGFGAFTVKSGKLASGDVIRVMYTREGLGADLGGTWANSDTTLSALKVTGGKLTPNFLSGEAGGRYDYTLVIDGDSGSIRLSPTAANKNFQVKAFLNEKVTDMTEGSSFFKRTESIPVKVGDTIYVGCGAKGWLSMNNQSGNTQSNDGTWYVLHVVSADTGADYVVGLIDDLPAAVKYENYSAAEDAVFAARAAYGILSKAEQAKVRNLAKLEKLEQAIASFRSVDTLKAQISDLPEADKLSVAHSQAVAAAEKMFLALTTEQKDCLTIAEVEKAEAVFAEMKRILEAPIKDAEAKIDAIGEVTLERGEAVLTAQAAFNALTPEQQAQVSNADKLQSAVTKLAALRKAFLTEKLDEPYKTTGDFMSKLGTPTVNSVGGEWMVIGLARSGRPVPAGYYDNVVEYVKAKADANERLHPAKVTDNARVILALTAIGKDVTNVGGHNLLKGLDNMAYVQTQGINGPIFTLIALDSHNYPTMGDVTREKLIQVILDAQLTDGGWDLSAENADPDMTAMAIQALAPYYKTNETVKAAVDKALEALSALQRNDGGFGSWGTVNSESCAQVIVALTALGIDPATDSRFVKNDLTVLDALASFYVTGGGFKHVADKGRDGMATEQGYYALAAYYRFANAQTRLYDMTDVTVQTAGSTVTPATGDAGVLVWVIALPVTALAAAFVLKRKEREA